MVPSFGYEKFQLSRDFETCLGAKPTERKKKGALVHLVHTYYRQDSECKSTQVKKEESHCPSLNRQNHHSDYNIEDPTTTSSIGDSKKGEEMAFKRASRKRDRWQALSMTIIALSVTTPPCDARIRVTKRQVAIFPQPSRQRFNQGILLDLKGQQMRSGSIFDDDRHDKDPDEQDETDDPLEPFTRYPSNSPTNVPSHSQSPSRHTTQPTYKQPTKIPSPTMLPTRSRYTTQPTSNKQPTKIPSPTILPSRYTPQPTNKQPTKIPSPTITPSKAPSRSNKQPGSNHPTEIPSSQPGSNHPTEIPSSEPPSTHPTEKPSSPPTCLLEIIDGNIGEVNSADAVILRYLYEIETDPLSTASMDQEVIPDLELAMLKYLFQGAGPGCGAGDQRRMSVYSFDSKRLEGMMGMSTSPSDVVSSEGKYCALCFCFVNAIF